MATCPTASFTVSPFGVSGVRIVCGSSSGTGTPITLVTQSSPGQAGPAVITNQDPGAPVVVTTVPLYLNNTSTVRGSLFVNNDNNLYNKITVTDFTVTGFGSSRATATGTITISGGNIARDSFNQIPSTTTSTGALLFSLAGTFNNVLINGRTTSIMATIVITPA